MSMDIEFVKPSELEVARIADALERNRLKRNEIDRRITLSADESRRFMDALNAAFEPNNRLARALK